ncbi:MAG: AraC family transcriptional regulator [Opitutaceae bacterium]|jgi:AraC-like DNA-binding protein
MISGARNLAYISRGKRTYGRKPIAARARGYWEIEFILSGQAQPNGVPCDLALGSGHRLYISPPDSSHGWTDKEGGVSEVFVLHFRDAPDELRDCAPPARPTLVEISKKDYQDLSPSLEAVWNDSAAKTPRASLQVQQLLIEITRLAIIRLNPSVVSTDAIDVVQKTLNWLEQNIGEQPDVSDAAKAVGISPSHLRRLFAAAGKPSPKSELTRLRIEAAQRCLHSHWTQEAITQYLGYSDVSAFARAFRAICGMPPKAWMDHNS